MDPRGRLLKFDTQQTALSVNRGDSADALQIHRAGSFQPTAAFSTIPWSSIASSVARTAAIASIPPPKVVPRSFSYMAARRPFADQARADRQAAAEGFGERNDIGLDTARKRRFRQKTSCRCGRYRSAPRRISERSRVHRRYSCSSMKNSGGASRTPAIDWIGSSIIAAVSSSASSRTLSISPNSASTCAGTFGRPISRYLPRKVALIESAVRP